MPDSTTLPPDLAEQINKGVQVDANPPAALDQPIQLTVAPVPADASFPKAAPVHSQPQAPANSISRIKEQLLEGWGPIADGWINNLDYFEKDIPAEHQEIFWKARRSHASARDSLYGRLNALRKYPDASNDNESGFLLAARTELEKALGEIREIPNREGSVLETIERDAEAHLKIIEKWREQLRNPPVAEPAQPETPLREDSFPQQDPATQLAGAPAPSGAGFFPEAATIQSLPPARADIIRQLKEQALESWLQIVDDPIRRLESPESRLPAAIYRKARFGFGFVKSSIQSRLDALRKNPDSAEYDESGFLVAAQKELEEVLAQIRSTPDRENADLATAAKDAETLRTNIDTWRRELGDLVHVKLPEISVQLEALADVAPQTKNQALQRWFDIVNNPIEELDRLFEEQRPDISPENQERFWAARRAFASVRNALNSRLGLPESEHDVKYDTSNFLIDPPAALQEALRQIEQVPDREHNIFGAVEQTAQDFSRYIPAWREELKALPNPEPTPAAPSQDPFIEPAAAAAPDSDPSPSAAATQPLKPEDRVLQAKEQVFQGWLGAVNGLIESVDSLRVPEEHREIFQEARPIYGFVRNAINRRLEALHNGSDQLYGPSGFLETERQWLTGVFDKIKQTPDWENVPFLRDLGQSLRRLSELTDEWREQYKTIDQVAASAASAPLPEPPARAESERLALADPAPSSEAPAIFSPPAAVPPEPAALAGPALRPRAPTRSSSPLFLPLPPPPPPAPVDGALGSETDAYERVAQEIRTAQRLVREYGERIENGPLENYGYFLRRMLRATVWSSEGLDSIHRSFVARAANLEEDKTGENRLARAETDRCLSINRGILNVLEEVVPLPPALDQAHRIEIETYGRLIDRLEEPPRPRIDEPALLNDLPEDGTARSLLSEYPQLSTVIRTGRAELEASDSRYTAAQRNDRLKEIQSGFAGWQAQIEEAKAEAHGVGNQLAADCIGAYERVNSKLIAVLDQGRRQLFQLMPLTAPVRQRPAGAPRRDSSSPSVSGGIINFIAQPFRDRDPRFDDRFPAAPTAPVRQPPSQPPVRRAWKTVAGTILNVGLSGAFGWGVKALTTTGVSAALDGSTDPLSVCIIALAAGVASIGARIGWNLLKKEVAHRRQPHTLTKVSFNDALLEVFPTNRSLLIGFAIGALGGGLGAGEKEYHFISEYGGKLYEYFGVDKVFHKAVEFVGNWRPTHAAHAFGGRPPAPTFSAHQLDTDITPRPLSADGKIPVYQDPHPDQSSAATNRVGNSGSGGNGVGGAGGVVPDPTVPGRIAEVQQLLGSTMALDQYPELRDQATELFASGHDYQAIERLSEIANKMMSSHDPALAAQGAKLNHFLAELNVGGKVGAIVDDVEAVIKLNGLYGTEQNIQEAAEYATRAGGRGRHVLRFIASHFKNIRVPAPA